MEHRLSSLALIAALAAGCQEAPAGVERGAQAFDYCVQCHGADGAGNPDIAAPAIAGLPAWYVEAQLHKFRDGRRGAHPDDQAGLRMRPMSRVLKSDEDVASVSAYVATMPKVAPDDISAADGIAAGGDAKVGATKYAVCIACHGADGAGNEALKAPPIAGSDPWYIYTQLSNFKSGLRGAAKGDVTGAQMRPMAMTLTDDQAMRDVIAHIQTLGK